MKNEPTVREDGQNLLDPFFDDFFGFPEFRGMNHLARGLAMKTDIKQENDSYVMDIELPGFDKKDIRISLKDGYLTVAAEKTESSDDTKKGKYCHVERYSGMTSRSYYVGNIDEKMVKASYDKGILTLSFPKQEKKELENQHTIAIQ